MDRKVRVSLLTMYTQLPKFLQCQGSSRSNLSAIRPVYTSGHTPLPPFCISVHSKGS